MSEPKKGGGERSEVGAICITISPKKNFLAEKKMEWV
jgi:hypothetical protein